MTNFTPLCVAARSPSTSVTLTRYTLLRCIKIKLTKWNNFRPPQAALPTYLGIQVGQLWLDHRILDALAYLPPDCELHSAIL